eukprot:TRINITY_DN10469_c0_g1_i1.p3 TRINITY_DN10469_c0_g1~~TRINITY_DN10469_c0_g1_i1.p3  ORF type:complete len:120 (-),score=39.40 TRINITY_DN10469_c0_g1_i1:222-581(-)
MKRHRKVTIVHLWGALALRNLALDDGANAATIGALGGIKALIGAMLTFKDDCSVQEQSVAALRNIAVGNEENERQVSELRGIEVVLRAMRRFRGCGPSTKTLWSSSAPSRASTSGTRRR